jgi:protein-tyrosine-phosphatase
VAAFLEALRKGCDLIPFAQIFLEIDRGDCFQGLALDRSAGPGHEQKEKTTNADHSHALIIAGNSRLDNPGRPGYKSQRRDIVKYRIDNPLRILFVCFANMCRSPMAVAIVKKRLGEAVFAESAGIAAFGNAPSQEAVELVRALFGADISRHRPRNISEVDLSRFDFILAMDSPVFMRLQEMDSVPKEKLFAWEIDDPIGRGIEAYRKAAKKIERQLDQFLLNRDDESPVPPTQRSKKEQ